MAWTFSWTFTGDIYLDIHHWVYITGGYIKKKTNYSKEVYSLLSPKRHQKPQWKKRILKNKLASCFRKI